MLGVSESTANNIFRALDRYVFALWIDMQEGIIALKLTRIIF